MNLNTLQNEITNSKLLHTAFSLFPMFKKNKRKSDLSETESHALNSLLQNKVIIIRKSDKSYTIAVIDKDSYKKKMKPIISDR